MTRWDQIVEEHLARDAPGPETMEDEWKVLAGRMGHAAILSGCLGMIFSLRKKGHPVELADLDSHFTVSMGRTIVVSRTAGTNEITIRPRHSLDAKARDVLHAPLDLQQTHVWGEQVAETILERLLA